MGAVEALITATCIGLSGNIQDACEKSLEAGSKQSGVEQNINRFEDKVSKNADQKARGVIGDSGMEVAGGVAFVVKSVADKAILVKIPSFIRGASMDAKIGQEKSGLTVEWKF